MKPLVLVVALLCLHCTAIQQQPPSAGEGEEGVQLTLSDFDLPDIPPDSLPAIGDEYPTTPLADEYASTPLSDPGGLGPALIELGDGLLFPSLSEVLPCTKLHDPDIGDSMSCRIPDSSPPGTVYILPDNFAFQLELALIRGPDGNDLFLEGDEAVDAPLAVLDLSPITGRTLLSQGVLVAVEAHIHAIEPACCMCVPCSRLCLLGHF